MATSPGRYSNIIHSPDSLTPQVNASDSALASQASQARANISNSRDSSSEHPLNEIHTGPALGAHPFRPPSPSYPNPSNNRPPRQPNTALKNPFQAPPGTFVDLTQESPCMSQPVRDARSGKRMPRDTAEVPPSSSKKRRVDAIEDEIEELDLCDVQSDTDLARVLERQRVATVRAQQEQADLPTKLANMTCVVCMEEMTNMTATHCGHLFCHTCLMEALIAGENQASEPGKGASKCPICRKKIRRPKQNKDTSQVIPLEIKVKRRPAFGKGKIKT